MAYARQVSNEDMMKIIVNPNQFIDNIIITNSSLLLQQQHQQQHTINLLLLYLHFYSLNYNT